MPKTVKLGLDIFIGAVVPVLILKWGTAPFGTLNAYLLAALIPVAYVMIDLLLITRRFNFITSYGGLSAIMRGALAFWYVDGAAFAFKDSVSYLFAMLVFGGSYFLTKPVTSVIAMQGLAPETPQQESSLEKLLGEPTVLHALRLSTLLIAATNIGCGIFNYFINLRMVTAPFNTPAFNDQVANVNAITRVVLVIPDMLALFWAFSLMYKAMYALLPAPADGAGDENFWDLVEQRDAQLRDAQLRDAEQRDEAAAMPGVGAQALASKQARALFEG